jgi:serine/threonine-protein kinase
MATVYLALDLKHNRRVALKVLRPELTHSVGVERFRREITIAAGLQHPHILGVHDSGETAGYLWFTMPYVRGESLRDRLRREPKLSLAEATRITREAAQALLHAHRASVIHRDIKPENILLAEDGSALVADFGIARALADGRDPHLTETGLSLGTPTYMAPEQATGERSVDAHADQYALAVTCYEMLAGTPPFTGPTAAALIAQRFTRAPPSLRATRPDVPPEVDAAVARALSLKAEDRFASVGEFAHALGGTVPTPQPTTAVTSGARQKRFVLWALPLLAALALAVVLLSRPGGAPRGGAAGMQVTRVAVLPFENLGDTADAYFADGVSDAVRSKLTSLPGLGVIARASSMDYRGTRKSPEEIARELGVRYLLTGTVRWAKHGDTSQVQVSPELVEIMAGGSPESRWAQPFEAPLTDVFQMQATIAAKVAGALDVALGSRNQLLLAKAPTASLEAYDAYLKGEAVSQALGDITPATVRRALVYYEQAAARDSTFGLAWARIAGARAQLFTGAALALEGEAALRALERAEALAPAAPETFFARYSYETLVRYDQARGLQVAEAALVLQPDNPIMLFSAGASSAAVGRTEHGVALMRRARALDPHSMVISTNMFLDLLYLRRWPEARTVADDALASTPSSIPRIHLAAMSHLAEGDLAAAQRVLAAAPQDVDRAALNAYVAVYGDLYWILDDEAQRQVLTLGPEAFDGHLGTWGLVQAQIHYVRGDKVPARSYADSAQQSFGQGLLSAPDDPQARALYGLSLAYAGRKQDAIREGTAAATRLPMTKDRFNGGYIEHVLVRIYTLVGEPDLALDHLERLLGRGYYLSPAWLSIDPAFAPLKGNPRFEKLISGAGILPT